MEEADKIKLEALIRELEGYRGRHTELVTVYVPSGYNLNMIAKQIDSEKSTAENIKSKTTRKNVLDALDKISRHLKLYKQTPPNGLALFSGNISKVEGQADIQLWAIEPVHPLKAKLYRCDQEFVLEPLKDMVSVKEVYGLIVLDRREATLGLLEGKTIVVLQHLTSGVPGKFKAGGQSARRFERLIDELARNFFKKIAEAAKKHFFERPKLKGILIGGPMPSKENFVKESDLMPELKRKIIAMKDIGYTDESGLKMLVEESADILVQESITKEKEIMNKFFAQLATKPEKISYGVDEVRKALKMGAVDKLLLSSSLKELKELEQIAGTTSTEVVYISEETEEGVQFKNLGGAGAFLRYQIE